MTMKTGKWKISSWLMDQCADSPCQNKEDTEMQLCSETVKNPKQGGASDPIFDFLQVFQFLNTMTISRRGGSSCVAMSALFLGSASSAPKLGSFPFIALRISNLSGILHARVFGVKASSSDTILKSREGEASSWME